MLFVYFWPVDVSLNNFPVCSHFKSNVVFSEALVMETKDMLYIVTEYVKNGEMFDYLTSHGRLSEDEARKKFWQILSAVEYCHNHHIVHRDLKTENLLLDANMNIKLADFGFGNFYKPGEPLSTWCGSPPYAAPEIFEGKEYEGPQLDIWSLGVVLYILVCGSLPFDGPTLPALRQRVLEGRFRIPYFMSQDCENLIRRMLVVDPLKRITIAQIKQHRWIQADASLPMQTLSYSLDDYNSNLGDYSEQVLGIMQSLGIDRQRTVESLQNSSYNHFAAIYYLLLERIKEHKNSLLLNRQTACRQQRPRSTEITTAEVPQETLTTDCLRSPLMVQQPQNVAPSSFPTEMDCDSSSMFQPVLFPVDPSFNGILQNRPISPNSLLETTITEDVRQERNMEEDAMQFRNSPCVPNTTSRRHTLAEVSTCCHQCTPPCIVISASPSPSDGTSSDSCLSSFSNDTYLPPNNCLMSQVASSGLTPVKMMPVFLNTQSTTPVLQAQGCMSGASLLPVSFQEGRRASDTSLTQGLKAFRQQLRKNARAKGFLGLNKIKGLARQVCQSPSSRFARSGLSHFPAPQSGSVLSNGGNRDGRSLLEEVLHQQRMLQLQHQQAIQSVSPQPPQHIGQMHSMFSFVKTAVHKPSNGLLLGELQRESSFELAFSDSSSVLQPHLQLFGTSISPVSSAAHLLDTQLYINTSISHASPAFLQQTHLSFPTQNCESLMPRQSDCEMEDLGTSQFGNFVLVK
ncbi:serine/threonine-protein kinase SIK1 isoform X2 [Protopterus annectens]|uniref:serine/threonine-protein kinase SIK1 isoform X2 n=1 Tax=Protopterus annectens TaxID=7888 RepID=UPI001CFAC66E|nr:serine/threonine-protein kinase SIK1 isoform X2 [Protopterus annectens]